MENFPTGVPQLRLSELIENLVGLPAQPQRAMLPHKTLVCLLHSLPMLMSSLPTMCFSHELPFTVVNAGRPTSFSIEALYMSIRGIPCKNFPLSVVRLYY